VAHSEKIETKDKENTYTKGDRKNNKGYKIVSKKHSMVAVSEGLKDKVLAIVAHKRTLFCF